MQRLKWIQFWQRENATHWSWIESIVITTVVLLLCYVSNPTNPFYVNSIFPWPWFAGMIIALQYGFGPAILSVIMMALAIANHASAAALSTAPYQTYLLTGMLFIFICALYSSGWMRRVLRAEELYEHTEQQLDTLSRSYNVLRVSYDYLEKSLISKPVTMREIEKQLQQHLLESGGEINQKNATYFLEIVSQYCSLLDAGIYLCKQNKIDPSPVAAIGTMQELDLHDPLVRYVIDNNEESYVTLNDMSDSGRMGYIVVVPMYTSSEKLIGMLVVKDMSFWRLNAETLQIMQILTLYFSEEVEVVRRTKPLLKLFPDCPPDFLKELNKLLYLKKSVDVDSAVVALRIDQSHQSKNIISSIKKQQRGLDYLWHHYAGDVEILITLMPFTNAVGISGYLSRVNQYFLEQHGKSTQALGVTERSLLLYNQKAEVIIEEILQDVMGTFSKQEVYINEY